MRTANKNAPARCGKHQTGADPNHDEVNIMSQASETIAPAVAQGKTRPAAETVGNIGRAMQAAQGKAKGKPTAKAQAATPARQAATQGQRTVITFEAAAQVCPHAGVAANISRLFGLDPVDYHAIREQTEEHEARIAQVLAASLSEKAIEMHMQRIVDAYVRSAHGAGVFYEGKADQAHDLSSKIANEERDEDRQGVDGMANRAERARDFAAQMGLQAYALLAAAQGAVDAYAHVTGNDWKPYAAAGTSAQGLARQSATAQLSAFEK
jgi:hypothetical protein